MGQGLGFGFGLVMNLQIAGLILPRPFRVECGQRMVPRNTSILSPPKP